MATLKKLIAPSDNYHYLCHICHNSFQNGAQITINKDQKDQQSVYICNNCLKSVIE